MKNLGNGVKVGFSLENGFSSDDGKLSTANRLFDREALLYVAGDFGELGMGRQGDLASGNGRYGLFGGKVSPFSTGWSDIAGHKYVMGAGFGRMDNSVTYKTPTFAGVNVLAQYSFNKDSTDTDREGSSAVDRQYALGASFTAGDLYLTGIVTQTNLQSLGKQDVEDPLTVSLGGNYNFGVAKLYVATQYFKDSDLSVKQIDRYDEKSNKTGCQDASQFDGFGLPLVLTFPLSAVRPRSSLVTWMPKNGGPGCSGRSALHLLRCGLRISALQAHVRLTVQATTWTPMTRSTLAMMTRLPSPLSTPSRPSRVSNNCPFA